MTAPTNKLDGAKSMDQKTQMREGFEAQRAAGMNVDWFTWQIAWHDALFTVHDVAGDAALLSASKPAAPTSEAAAQAEREQAYREATKPRPETSGVGEYCQPGDRREPRWIVMYDDADRSLSIFEDEQDARDCFANSEAMGWNCWLFSPTPRGRAASPAAPAQSAEPVAALSVQQSDVIESALQILQDVKAGDGDYWRKLDETIAALDHILAQPVRSTGPIFQVQDFGAWQDVPESVWKHHADTHKRILYAAPQPSPTAVVLDERAVLEEAAVLCFEMSQKYSLETMGALQEAAGIIRTRLRKGSLKVALEYINRMAPATPATVLTEDTIKQVAQRFGSIYEDRITFYDDKFTEFAEALATVAQPVEQTQALTDEQIIGLLRTAYASGWAASGEGYNFEHPGKNFDDAAWFAKRDKSLDHLVARFRDLLTAARLASGEADAN